ncbi:MAG: hypothetical protein ACLRZ6_08210 [Lachnospiraceae bacterium]
MMNINIMIMYQAGVHVIIKGICTMLPEAEPLGEGYVNKVSKLWRKIADGSEEAEELFEMEYKAESKLAFDSGFVMPFTYIRIMRTLQLYVRMEGRSVTSMT